MRLLDKMALITGARRGIGRPIAKSYARESAHVVIGEIDSRTGANVALEISNSGRRSLFVRADLSRKDQIDAMIAKVLEEFG